MTKEVLNMANRVYERMVKFVGENVDIRVWVTADGNFEADIEKVYLLLTSFVSSDSDLDSLKKIMSSIERSWPFNKCAAAIEVLDKKGNGILLYPDWN